MSSNNLKDLEEAKERFKHLEEAKERFKHLEEAKERFKHLEEAKERFKHLPEPNNGWYFKYANNDDRQIIAASLLGKWYMYTQNVLTYGQVANNLMTYFQNRNGYAPDHVKASDAKLKDFMLIVWGERNHNEIERESDAELRKLLARHYHQYLRPGEYNYFEGVDWL